MSVQALQVNKTGTTIQLTFATAFSQPPTVIVSPAYSSPVGNVETVTAISTTGCTIVSGNMAADYIVNVLAVDTSTTAFGSLPMQAGMLNKTSQTVTGESTGGRFSSSDPVTLLTSYWQGSTGGVGFLDTLDDSAATEFSVISGNMAANYYTNFLRANPGVGSESGKTLQAGIANKTGSGELRVYFATPFAAPPVVVLSPWWNDANAGVGRIDTVTQVTRDYFVVNSGNAAPNYFTSWMAFGS
jgi:hypothetical protein